MNNSTILTESTNENYLAGAISFLVSACSLYLTVSVAYFVLHLDSIKGQFAILTVSLASADAGVLAIFAFWCSPMLITQSELSVEFLGRKIGLLGMWLYFVSLNMVVVIAVNRCMAVVAPLKYDSSFSMRKTKIAVGLVWVYSLLLCIPNFFPGCDFFFNNGGYFWTYEATACGFWVGWILDFGVCFSNALIALVINTVTVAKMKRSNKIQERNGRQMTAAQTAAAEQRRNKEIKFFILSVVNSTMLLFMIISFYIVSRFAYEKWGWFFSTSMMWMVSHSTNAVIFVAMIRDLRSAIAKKTFVCFGTQTCFGKKNEISTISGATGTTGARELQDTTPSNLPKLFEHVSSTYTYILACGVTKEAVIIDPVIETVHRDADLINQLHLNLKFIANTHVHADHVTGSGELKKFFPKSQSVISEISQAKSDVHVKHGDILTFGKEKLEVRATPGHTDGNAELLYEGVHSQILSLPPDYLLYPAHDYKGFTCSTVAEELEHNTRLTKPKEDFIHTMKHLNLPYPRQIDKSLPANLVCGVYEWMDDRTRTMIEESHKPDHAQKH